MDVLDMGKIVHEVKGAHQHDVRPPAFSLGEGTIFECDCGQRFELQYMIPGNAAAHRRWQEIETPTEPDDEELDAIWPIMPDWNYSVLDDIAAVAEEMWLELEEKAVDLLDKVAGEDAMKYYGKIPTKVARWSLRKFLDVTEKE